MKRVLCLIPFLFPISSLASVTINGNCYDLLWNPFTGTNQYVDCSLSSTSLITAGVYGYVIDKRKDGTQVSTTTTLNTDQGRGNMLLDFFNQYKQDGDTFILSASTFSIGSSTMDLALDGNMGSVSIQGQGMNKTLLEGIDGRVVLNPGNNSIISDMSVECVAVQDFCLPIGTEDHGSTGVTIKNVHLIGPRDVLYADPINPVNWNVYDSIIEGGWDGIIEQTSFSTTTVISVYNSQVNMTANPANDDGGQHVHGALAFNPKGTLNLYNTDFLVTRGSVENVGVDVSGGYVNMQGGSFTVKGASPFHVRNDSTGGQYHYSIGTVLVSSMCSFNNQISAYSFSSLPTAIYRFGSKQAILQMDPVTSCMTYGDLDSIQDGNTMQFCADAGTFDINISGDHPFFIESSSLKSTNPVYFQNIQMPETGCGAVGQSLNICDNGDVFNSPNVYIGNGSAYNTFRINTDGSFLFNQVGGSFNNTTVAKPLFAVHVSTSGGVNPTTSTPGFDAAVGGVLFAHNVSTGNTGTTETDFYKDQISSNTIRVSSWTISYDYAGQALNSATATSEFKVYLATTVIYDSGADAMTAAASWRVKGYCMWNSKTTARCETDMVASGITVATAVNVLTVGGLNWNANTTLKLTGTRAGVGAATNDITAMTGIVEFKPAP